MKSIKLTKGYVALIDDSDYDAINKYNWQALVCKSGVYARTHVWNKETKNRTSYLMHRMILSPPKELDIDHIDGNGLNNTRANLRLATRTQNQCNTRKLRGKVPYKGVSWEMKDQKYRAEVRHERIVYYLGQFGSAVCAALAYDKKARELHGEFAQLNFPEINHEKLG